MKGISFVNISPLCSKPTLKQYATLWTNITLLLLLSPPPQPKLSWNNVVDYAFLAEFNLLHDSCWDVRDCPWTRPAV